MKKIHASALAVLTLLGLGSVLFAAPASSGKMSFAGEDYNLLPHLETQTTQKFIRSSETAAGWTQMLVVRRLPYPDLPSDYLEAVKESALLYNPDANPVLLPMAGGREASLHFQCWDVAQNALPPEFHLLRVRREADGLIVHEFIYRGTTAEAHGLSSFRKKIGAQQEVWEKEFLQTTWPVVAASPAVQAAWNESVGQIAWYLHNPHVFVESKLIEVPFSLAHRPTPPEHAWLYIRPKSTLQKENLPFFFDAVRAYRATGLDLKNQKAVDDAALPFLLQSNPEWPLEPGWRQLLDGLRYLNLRGSSVTDAGAATLSRMIPLQVLILNNAITDSGLRTLATALTNLVKFRPGGPAITDAGASSFSGLHKLHRLDLSETSITGKGLRALTPLPLIEVDLGPAMADDALAVLKNIPTLVHIEMAKTKITDKGVEFLQKFSQLHTLFIAGQLDDRGVQTLIQIPTLRRLDISNSRITDKGLTALSALSDLEELGLTHTAISDQGLKALSSMMKLRFLEVSNTSVTISGLAQLSELPALDVVSFSHKGELTLGDLKPLGQLKALRTVIINGSPLKHEALLYLLHNAAQATPPQVSRWVGLAYAEDAIPLNDTTDVAQLMDKGSPNALHDTGLHRIHDVEADLDHVIPDVAAPRVTIPQDTADNFIGEFNVSATASNKKE
jgi:hypothetical protein